MELQYILRLPQVLLRYWTCSFTGQIDIKVDEGTDRMKEIASFIHEGAMAFFEKRI
jgi:Na+/H+-translocating membrane pyrophosphatase